MRLRTLFAACCLAVSLPSLAQVSAGVSDERVKLPGAPGSIDGAGENATVEGNHGALRQTVPFDVPPGFAGLTPEIALNYSSNAGSSVVGIGWTMPELSIERMTSKGLQKYAPDDRFVVDGSTELVRTAQDTDSATYRVRFEGAFIRYTWKSIGTGEAGYWTAEHPDGRVSYYGADAAGNADTLAQVRVPTTSRTFRWQLKATVDRYGHQLRYAWTKDASGTPLLERIDYVFEGATPRYSLRFTYENRGDIISDGRPGFELRLTQRLKDVRLFAGSEVVRAWVLNYETPVGNRNVSRLAEVRRFGRNDLQYPVTFKFAYSKTLEGACDTDCQKPFVKSMGQLPAQFATGNATLIDINGDALPDVLNADPNTGAHTFYYAKLDAEGQVSFATTGVTSVATANTSVFKYGTNAKIQVLDVNGDGFVDMTESSTGSVLCNDGSGDWQPVNTGICVGGDLTATSDFSTDDPDADPDVGDAVEDEKQVDPLYVRFFDYDNDRRIDRMRTSTGGTTVTVLANTPTGQQAVSVDSIGLAFDESDLELADMNGDGLQDPAQLIRSADSVTVWYRLNFGYGKWGPIVSQTLTTTGLGNNAELQDINGDGLTDVIAVTGNSASVWLNRNGGLFDDERVIGAGLTLPDRTVPGTVVTFADMNGNGSDDIVYINPTSGIRYVELFPVRPNLLSRIENGIGSVQAISYGTSISEQARDVANNQPWQYRVPNPMTVVKQTVRYVTLTGSDSAGLREITDYRYHSGFYNGAEKQFAGYAEVEREVVADMSRDAMEPSLSVQRFNLGATNPLLGSVLEKDQVFAMPGRVPLRETRHTVEACPVEGAANAMPTVSFVCHRATEIIVIERDATKALTLRTERDFDGYGNVTAVRELGVVNQGTPESPTACTACVASGIYGAACGMTCTGDERFTTTTFIAPTTAWILGRASKTEVSAAPGVTGRETRMFYDGPAFEGLPAGQLTNGTVTRVARRSGAGANDFIDVQRFELDAHGNVAVSLEPTASFTNALAGRTKVTFDAAGLNELSRELLLGGTEVSSIKQETGWDAAFGLIAQQSNYVPYLGSTALATAQLSRFRYDEHGRLSKVLDPGDTDARPGESYVYELGNPASRVERRQHSSATSGEDVISAQCFDGRGRVFQSLRKIDATNWQVDGFVEFDAQGVTVREYQPYRVSSGACAMTPPADVRFSAFRFDGLGRGLSRTDPGGGGLRNSYAPLTTTTTDALEQVTVERTDGLSRPVAIERHGLGDPAMTQVTYDAYGNVATTRDAAGKVRAQTWDAMGRLTKVDDLNAGTLAITYDAANNPIRRVDGQGNVALTAFDAIQRKTAQWSEADEAGTKRTWQYDRLSGCAECTNAGGKLVRSAWPAGGEDAFGYDAEGRDVFRQRTQGGKTFVFRNAYDDADRELSTVYPGGLAIDRRYDGADRMIGVANIVDSLSFDARGNQEAVSYSNGVKGAWTWDEDDELTTQTLTDKSGAAFLKTTFTRNAKKLTTAIDDGALGGHVRHGATFTRDAWDRVLTAELPREGGSETLTWTYDVVDNVTSIKSSRGTDSRAHAGDLSYGVRPNAVLSAGSLTLTYDGAGRLSSRGNVNLERDFLGRIVSATGGAIDGHYTWGDGERVERIEGDSTTWYLGDELELRDGISTVYVRIGGERVARLESDALAATVYSDLAPASGDGTLTPSGDDTIDIADAWLAQAAGKGVVSLSGGPAPSSVKALLQSAARRLLISDVTWLHQDHVDSIVAATDANGAVIAEQSFNPTGTVREAKGYVDAYGFTGQLRDDATGLWHFQNRELDALTARWDMPDPEFESFDPDDLRELGESTTAYAYVGNEFLDTNDPTGLKGAKPVTRQRSGSGVSPPKMKLSLKQRAKNDVKRGVTYMKAGMKMSRGQKSSAARAKSAVSSAASKVTNKIFPYAKRSRQEARARKEAQARGEAVDPGPRGTKNLNVKTFAAIGGAILGVAVVATLGGLSATGQLGGGGGDDSSSSDSGGGGGMGDLFGNGSNAGGPPGGGDQPTFRLGQ